MRKHVIIYLAALLIMQCATIDRQGQTGDARPAFEKGGETLNKEIFNDWSLYSKGLLFKSMNEYNKAIDHFMDAAAFEKGLDRIYYQVAEFIQEDQETGRFYLLLGSERYYIEAPPPPGLDIIL